ncbi:hypothetical protein DFA_03679 [Cavenderia fasciculata]|uniref:DEP domain-containing protein n=1 Tax=Cavenderia fasciculata TaxID=261658 RepID=F4Q1P2_CACFS|nr:uncharacterized protein DFA_03679 [Cavenderia fasciculata]EGG18192.1 hypothetical protein DFA_03679 [Cavenderia fasciculata]|eukprot:XP_004357015.1 hypothetical protein DFA_03679 [Cavenderia fasciculata]
MTSTIGTTAITTMKDTYSSNHHHTPYHHHHHNHLPLSHSLGDDVDNTNSNNNISSKNYNRKEDTMTITTEAAGVDLIDNIKLGDSSSSNGGDNNLVTIQEHKEYVKDIMESTSVQTNCIQLSTSSPPTFTNQDINNNNSCNNNTNNNNNNNTNFQLQHQNFNPNPNTNNNPNTNTNNNIESKRRNLNCNRNSSDSLPCSPPSSPTSPGKVYFGKLSSNSIPDRTVIYSPINNTKYHIKDIISMMKTPPTGLTIKDRYTGFQYHKQCFTGFDMVEWLLTHGICATRNHCIQLGQYLLDKSIIRHVYCDQPFRDSNLLYVFKEFLGISDDKIYIIVQKMKQEDGVERKDRSKLFKKFKDCFVGSEAVTWLLKNCQREVGARDEAIRLCQEIMDLGLIVPASNSKDVFRDDGTFYIFRNIIYGGYLGKKKKHSQERKVKYFALKEAGENILWYYDSPKDPMTNTGINLNNAYIRECKCGGGADCFEIVSHQRIFCLKCSNYSFLRLWVEILSHQTTTISDENALFEEAEEYIKEDSIRQSDLFFESFKEHNNNNNINNNNNNNSPVIKPNTLQQIDSSSSLIDTVLEQQQQPLQPPTIYNSPDKTITSDLPILNDNISNQQPDEIEEEEEEEEDKIDDDEEQEQGDDAPSTNTCDDYFIYSDTSKSIPTKDESNNNLLVEQQQQQSKQQSIAISTSQSDLITFNSSTSYDVDCKTELGISTQSFLIDTSSSQLPLLNMGSMDSIQYINEPPTPQQQQLEEEALVVLEQDEVVEEVVEMDKDIETIPSSEIIQPPSSPSSSETTPMKQDEEEEEHQEEDEESTITREAEKIIESNLTELSSTSYLNVNNDINLNGDNNNNNSDHDDDDNKSESVR